MNSLPLFAHLHVTFSVFSSVVVIERNAFFKIKIRLPVNKDLSYGYFFNVYFY